MRLSDLRSGFFEIHEHPSAVVVTLTRSQLSEEENIEQLGREFVDLIDQFQCLSIIVELSHVQYATSAFLGKLISLHRRLHRKEGKLVLCGVTGDVDSIFKTSRLHEYFTIESHIEDALKHFAPPTS